jgi:putative ABC transport system permease protein
MLRNYLKTAVRNLLRYKGFTIINVLSLTIGITGCLVIGLFVWDEWQYDKFVKDSDNIFRAYTKTTGTTSNSSTASVSPMFATYMQQQYPEVVNTTRLLMWNGKMLMEKGEIKEYEEKGLIADSTFFKIFPLKFLKGDPNTALEGSSVVITEELAEKYFAKTDPVGKIIKLDKDDYMVKGVLASLPEHFHLDFNYIIPLASAGLPPERMQRWGWQQFFTYIKVKPGTNVDQLQAKFQDAVKKEAHPQTKDAGFTYLPFFQPLKDIHLHSTEFAYDNAKRGNNTYVKGLGLIALFVLIIACFNFINLATARSFRRAKEIGVRKVIGADRKQLVLQFTGETILLAVMSMLIAALATMLIVPFLNSFTEKSIHFNPITNPVIGLSILFTGVVIGMLAGTYPAIVLSGFQPIKVLKGMKLSGDKSNSTAWLRQALVIVQFALSALLIVSTIIVYRQINFLHQKDLGFNKEQILFFNVRGDISNNKEAFKEELKRSPNVVSVTGGYGLPGDAVAGDGIIVPGKEGDKEHTANQFIVDHDYIKTMGLRLVAGRDFSKDMATDIEEAFIINETAVKELGFGTPADALGKRLNWTKWEKDSLNPIKKGRVIGIVKDFHFKSLHERVTTTILQIYPPVLSKMAVKIKTGDINNTIEYVNSVWDKFSPGFPLDYRFLDESFNLMYKAEDKLRLLLIIFTCMAIFVGCMGLFGLAAFSAEQRSKEISIRKVLGATVVGIVSLLSEKFLKLVLIASLIAFPIAWFATNRWLDNFPYRVTISWWVFAIAALIALLIALITVSFQAIKIAVSNPVKTLRTE